MSQITDLLEAGESRRSAVVLRQAGIGDIGWVIHRQALLYSNEFGWNQEFEALLAEIGAQFIRKFKPARERAWVLSEKSDKLNAKAKTGAKPRAAEWIRFMGVRPFTAMMD